MGKLTPTFLFTDDQAPLGFFNPDRTVVIHQIVSDQFILKQIGEVCVWALVICASHCSLALCLASRPGLE